MKNAHKYAKYTLIGGISALAMVSASNASAQYAGSENQSPNYVMPTLQPTLPANYAHQARNMNPAIRPQMRSGHMQPMQMYPVNPNSYSQRPNGQNLGEQNSQDQNFGPKYPFPAYKNLSHHLDGRKKLAYQVPARLPYTGQFQRWMDHEPEYKLYPGDQLDIVVSSAPEMSRTLTIGPDGRVAMPHIKPTMAAGKTFTELKDNLEKQLSTVLRDPTLAVTPRAYAPEQIYIGGEVAQQGTYTLTGPTGVLEAIIMSGGMLTSAKSGKIAVLRRAPNGGMMMRTIDMKNNLRNIREYDDNMQLRRNDVIFVPRGRLSEIGVWMTNFRNALPMNFNYTIGANNNFNGNIGP